MELEIHLENVKYDGDIVSGDWQLGIWLDGKLIPVAADDVNVLEMIERQFETIEDSRYLEISDMSEDGNNRRDHGWFVGQLLPIVATLNTQ